MTAPRNNRTQFYTLLAVGKKQLGMDDDSYRAFLAAHGAKEKDGRVSASTMTIGALVAAVEALKAKGFKPQGKNAAARAANWKQGMINKITAIWCTLADAGVLHDRGEAAMMKWCSRLTKKARLEWANVHDLNACIESLKKWAAREGVKLRG